MDEISLCVGEKCNSKTPLGNLHDLPLFYTFEKKILLYRKLVHFEKKVIVGTNPYPQEEEKVHRPKIVRVFSRILWPLSLFKQ